MRYREFALTTFTRKGKMLREDIAQSMGKGYSGVYAFDESDANTILLSGNSKGLSAYNVYTEHLIIDIDDDSLTEAKNRCKDIIQEHFKDTSIRVFFSGKKGFHIYVDIEPMYGKDVPYSQSQWLQSKGVNCDYSLYQHGRLLRNIGATHESTGNKKELVYSHSGVALHIPLLEKPQYTAAVDYTDDFTDIDRLKSILMKFITLVETDILPGNRYTSFWALSKDIKRAGGSQLLAVALCAEWNDKLSNPKSLEEVELAVSHGFKSEVYDER